MSEFKDDSRRFESLDRRAGLFLALALVIVIAVAVAILIRQGVFTQTSRLHFFSDSALGIYKGMSVQLSGFKIGSVEDLALEPDARVKVLLVVNSDTMRHISQDAEARLAKEGLIGASFIEVLPGSKQARPIPNNGVLKFERAGDLAQMADALAEKIHPILDDVKKLTESVNDPDGDLRQILRNVRQATAMVSELRQDLARLAQATGQRVDAVAGKVEQVLDRAADTLEKTGVVVDKASGTIETLRSTLSALDRQLPDMMLKLDRTLNTVEGITADARRLASGLAEELPPVIEDGRSVVEDAREIIDGAKRTWPIRTLLPPASETPLPLDSHDSAIIKR